MKFLNKISIGLLVLLCFVSSVSSTSLTYEEYKRGLMKKFTDIQEKSGILDGGKIDPRLLKNDTWYLPENKPLYDAGEALIIYLRENDATYQELEPQEWEQATNDLLEVDSWLGERIAWGNLVIKIAISNKVINWILRYLDENKTYENKEIQRVLRVMNKLKWYLPTKHSMCFLTFKNYNISSPFDADKLHYLNDNVQSMLDRKDDQRKKLRVYLFKNDKNKEISKIMDSWLENESQLASSISNYQDLYRKPIPFVTTQYSHYHKIWWRLYLHLLLLEQNKGVSYQWANIDVEDLYPILDNLYKAGDEFWIHDYYDKFYESYNTTKIVDKNIEDIMTYFREDRGMKSIWKMYFSRHERKLFSEKAKQDGSLRSKSKNAVIFSVHQFP